MENFKDLYLGMEEDMQELRSIMVTSGPNFSDEHFYRVVANLADNAQEALNIVEDYDENMDPKKSKLAQVSLDDDTKMSEYLSNLTDYHIAVATGKPKEEVNKLAKKVVQNSADIAEEGVEEPSEKGGKFNDLEELAKKVYRDLGYEKDYPKILIKQFAQGIEQLADSVRTGVRRHGAGAMLTRSDNSRTTGFVSVEGEKGIHLNVDGTSYLYQPKEEEVAPEPELVDRILKLDSDYYSKRGELEREVKEELKDVNPKDFTEKHFDMIRFYLIGLNGITDEAAMEMSDASLEYYWSKYKN